MTRVRLDALPRRDTLPPDLSWAQATAPLVQGAGWVRALAWVNGILALVLACTVVGLVVAWLFAWVAWLLSRMAAQLRQAQTQSNPWAVRHALDACAQQFVVQAWAMGAIAVLELFAWLWGG